MTFEISKNTVSKISTDLLIVFVFEEEKKSEKSASFSSSPAFAMVNEALEGQLEKVCSGEAFTGKSEEVVSVFTFGKIPASKIGVVGLGKKSEFSLNTFRKAVGSIILNSKHKISLLTIALPEVLGTETEELVSVATETAKLAAYTFEKYKSKKEEKKVLETIMFLIDSQAHDNHLKEVIKKAELYATATMVARDLVNEQSLVATPTYLASFAQDIAKAHSDITCKIFEKAALEKMGMHAFLGIARASDTPPKFIVLEYTPKAKGSSKKKVAIVGKGITFDSGGINVKPGDHMQDMKMDMAGAALVLGVFSVIEEIQPEYSVMGIIAATPNLISGSSIVPGDVVRASNGKTIEILNTDAEGRVTMADSLSYAVKHGATEIIDFATLTGACMVALGDEIAGVFSNNRDFVEKFCRAAEARGEKVWELPLEKDYIKLNKSDVADIANIASNRYGGAITAGLFLQEFVDNTPWIHVDIAGPAFSHKPSALGPKGGTGFGVRTILHLLHI